MTDELDDVVPPLGVEILLLFHFLEQLDLAAHRLFLLLLGRLQLSVALHGEMPGVFRPLAPRIHAVDYPEHAFSEDAAALLVPGIGERSQQLHV